MKASKSVKKSSRYSSTRKSRRTSHSPLKKIFSGIFLLFATFLAIIFLQNPQDLRQHAQVTYSKIVPTYFCMSLGGNCTNVKVLPSGKLLPCAGLVVSTPLKLDKTIVKQGESISGEVTFKNPCEVLYDIKGIFLGAHDPFAKLFKFQPESKVKKSIYPGQTVSIKGVLKIDKKATTGKWLAVAAYVDAAGKVHEDKTQVPFTVVPPCAGLVVSKAIALDKKQVTDGETITATITYKNPCQVEYDIKAVKISVRTAKGSVVDLDSSSGPGNGSGSSSAAMTISAGQEIALTGTYTVKAGDPRGVWKAFGAYQIITGTWRTDTKLANFKVVAPPKPTAVPTTSPNTPPKVPVPPGPCHPFNGQPKANVKYCHTGAVPPGCTVADPGKSVMCQVDNACQAIPPLSTALKPNVAYCYKHPNLPVPKRAGITCRWKVFGSTVICGTTKPPAPKPTSPSNCHFVKGVKICSPAPAPKPTKAAPNPTKAPPKPGPKPGTGAGLNQACRTNRNLPGPQSDGKGVFGTCQRPLYCITGSDTSVACKQRGDCNGTCKRQPGGIMPGNTCHTSNRGDTQGGCINGHRCNVSGDTSAKCKTSGACTGKCVQIP